MALDLAADCGDLRLGVAGVGQLGQRLHGLGLHFGGFLAVEGEAALCFGERRFARGVAVDLALGGGLLLARGVDSAAGVAQRIAGGAFGGGGGLEIGVGLFQRLAADGGVLAGLGQFVLDIGQAGTLGEAAGGAGRARGRRRQNHPSARRRLRARRGAGQP